MAVSSQQGKVGDRNDPNDALREKAELLRRFADIRAYFNERGITSYMPVFQAVDPTLLDASKNIGQWWSREAASLQPQHRTIIERMERVVEHLKAA